MFKNYKNSAIKKFSVLLAIIMVIASFSCCLVSAESETENPYIGTYENGYVQSSLGRIYTTPNPNIEFKNLDFEDGLKYWQSTQKTSVLVEEENNNYINLAKGDTVITYPITIKNPKAGQEFAVTLKAKSVDAANASTFYLRMYKYANNSGTQMSQIGVSNVKLEDWTDKSAKFTLTSTYIPENTEEMTFYFAIYNNAAPVYIDDVMIGFQTDTSFVYNSSTTREWHYPSVTENGETLVAFTDASNNTHYLKLSEAGYRSGYAATTSSYMMISNDDIVNGDFTEGMTGWGAYDNYQAKLSPKSFGSITDFDNDGVNEFCLNNTSYARPVGLLQRVKLNSVKAGERLSLYFEYKFADEGNTDSSSYIAGMLAAVESGMISNSNVSALKSTYSDDEGYVANAGTHTELSDGWIAATNFAPTGGSGNIATVDADSPDLSVAIYAPKGTCVYIRNVKIIVGKNIISDVAYGSSWCYEFFGDNNDGNYYDTDGLTKIYPYGTVSDGITTNGDLTKSQYALRLFNETDIFDFKTNGLKYWGAAVQDASAFGETTASQSATVGEDGTVTLKYDSKSAMGISSVYFRLPEAATENGTNYAVWFDYERVATDVTDATQSLLFASGKLHTNEDGSIYNSGGESKGVATYNAPAKLIDDIAYGHVNIQVTGTEFDYNISNFTIGYVDKGGMEKALYVYQDGTPRDGETGDANADGELDARDLVRMKKYVALYETPIYFAASDLDNDDAVSATDLGALRTILLSK